MEIRLVNRNDTSIELEFVNESETLLHLLTAKLLENKKVASATYLQEHPLLGHPRLHVIVTDGKPEAALRAAAKELRGSFDELDTLVVKSKQK